VLPADGVERGLHLLQRLWRTLIERLLEYRLLRASRLAERRLERSVGTQALVDLNDAAYVPQASNGDENIVVVHLLGVYTSAEVYTAASP